MLGTTVNRMPKSPDAGARDRVAISNRRARHEYFILDTYECGIVLVGSEVKSIRDGRANLSDSYARIEHGEVWLHGMHVSPYPFSRDNPDPDRKRKLLLHHHEIERLRSRVDPEQLQLIPLSIYFKDGRAKVELAVARGRKTHDKRQVIAERDADRDVRREMARRDRH